MNELEKKIIFFLKNACRVKKYTYICNAFNEKATIKNSWSGSSVG